jgi:hypothetical protein
VVVKHSGSGGRAAASTAATAAATSSLSEATGAASASAAAAVTPTSPPSKPKRLHSRMFVTDDQVTQIVVPLDAATVKLMKAAVCHDPPIVCYATFRHCTPAIVTAVTAGAKPELTTVAGVSLTDGKAIAATPIAQVSWCRPAIGVYSVARMPSPTAVQIVVSDSTDTVTPRRIPVLSDVSYGADDGRDGADRGLWAVSEGLRRYFGYASTATAAAQGAGAGAAVGELRDGDRMVVTVRHAALGNGTAATSSAGARIDHVLGYQLFASGSAETVSCGVQFDDFQS